MLTAACCWWPPAPLQEVQISRLGLPSSFSHSPIKSIWASIREEALDSDRKGCFSHHSNHPLQDWQYWSPSKGFHQSANLFLADLLTSPWSHHRSEWCQGNWPMWPWWLLALFRLQSTCPPWCQPFQGLSYHNWFHQTNSVHSFLLAIFNEGFQWWFFTIGII